MHARPCADIGKGNRNGKGHGNPEVQRNSQSKGQKGKDPLESLRDRLIELHLLTAPKIQDEFQKSRELVSRQPGSFLDPSQWSLILSSNERHSNYRVYHESYFPFVEVVERTYRDEYVFRVDPSVAPGGLAAKYGQFGPSEVEIRIVHHSRSKIFFAQVVKLAGDDTVIASLPLVGVTLVSTPGRSGFRKYGWDYNFRSLNQAGSTLSVRLHFPEKGLITKPNRFVSLVYYE